MIGKHYGPEATLYSLPTKYVERNKGALLKLSSIAHDAWFGLCGSAALRLTRLVESRAFREGWRTNNLIIVR